MPRHHPILVHKQISAQLQAGLLKQPPRSYPALVNYPPNPTPLQDPSYSNKKRRNIEPIKFIIKDRIRKAFYRDHPFEAYRPLSLVEESAHQILSKVNRDLSSCDHLAQISCKPSAEDCISFAEHLYHTKRYTLNKSYQIAVSEFRTLRFEEQIRASFARQEAEYYQTSPNDLIWEEDRNQGARAKSEQEIDRPIDHFRETEEEPSPWGRDLIKRSIDIQDEFIRKSNAKSKPINPDHPIQRTSPKLGSNNLSNSTNRLISPRVRNPNRLDTDDWPKFNELINTELIRKSKRLSSISK